jgi:hypothetical protein
MYYDDPLAGHFALAKCKDLIIRKYFWPEIKQDVKEYIDSYSACQRTRTYRYCPYGVLYPLPIPTEPF